MGIVALLQARKKAHPFILSKRFFSITTTKSINKNKTAACNSREQNPSLICHYFSLLHSSPTLPYLRHLHAHLIVTSIYDNVILSSKLILAYSNHRKLDPDGLFVFYRIPNRNIYSWNIIVGEFARSSSPEKSVDLFCEMWRGGEVRPDDYTLPLVLRACAGCGYVELGFLLHVLCVKLGLDGSLFVASALVFMYVTFGNLGNGRMLFDKMPKRDSVLWTSMLSGYVQHGEAVLGLGLFRQMVRFGVRLDGVVMVSLLLMCGQLGWLKHGKSVHGWCVRNCLGLELSLGNAIVDMYVKCGTLLYANRMFDEMPERDVFSWSSLILGYGLSGNVSVALDLFDQMHAKGIKPNAVTFLGVLSSCAHGGLVERVRSCFKLMQDYGVVAELKHYATVVDCLGRAGLLEEAERFIKEMPMEPDEAILGAILSGCRVHTNVEVGERIAKKLIRLEPDKAGYYVLLSNIYAAAGGFNEAEMVRDLMKEKNVCKLPGRSLIESKSDLPLQSHNAVQDCLENG